MSEIFDLVKLYPWLPSLKNLFPDKADIEPIDFINRIFPTDDYNKLKESFLLFFREVFGNPNEFTPFYLEEENNIDFYILLKIFLSIFNDRRVTNRVADHYSKIVNSKLNEDRNNDSILYTIYKDLNLRIKYTEEPLIYKKTKVRDQDSSTDTKFQIYFIDYLNLASRMKDDRRRLVNNSISEGYVFIQPKELNRLIQEYVRMKILDIRDIDDIKEELLNNRTFKKLFQEIQEIWEEIKENFEEIKIETRYQEGKDNKQDFPPCIQEILSKLEEGKNLVHTERLFIVWFLNALNYPEEKIIGLFSTLPDFDRDKTRYQVRYAIKKGYTPYSCKTLKSYDLCMAKKSNDDICLIGYYSKKQEDFVKISHPLAYVRIKTYRNLKKKEKSSEYPLDKND